MQHAKAVLSELLTGLDLKLNEEKSRVVDATKEGFDFLGFHFIRRLDGRSARLVTRVYPSKKSVGRFREKVRTVLDVNLSQLKEEADAVGQLNHLLTGWGSYFSHSNAGKAFRHLQSFVEWKLLKFISTRHKRPYTSMTRQSIQMLYDNLGLRQFPPIRYVK